MCRILADHRLRENAPLAGDQRGSRIVAGGFEAKYNVHFVPGPLPDPPKMH
jgi:hypothetical protein